MSNPINPDSRDFSKYDSMTTKDLESILTSYFLFPDEIEDKELVSHILEVLTERDKEIIEANISNLSWEKFLRDHPDIKELEECNLEKEHSAEISEVIQVPKRNKIFRNLAGMAAVFVCVLLVGTITAYAAGIDLFSAIAQWTEETFGFKSNATIASFEQKEVPPQLESLYGQLSIYATTPLIPTYLPPQYELIDEKVFTASTVHVINCLLSDGEESVTIAYNIHISTDAYIEYEKDDVEPEIVEVNNTKVYIFSNIDYYTAAWIKENVEGSITMKSKDELIKIVQSLK